jgi:hypothetical protein
VRLFGVDVPVASMALSLVGLWMARGVAAAREGPTKGGRYLTGALVMILVALVIDRQPSPGPAIVYGLGIGGSGIVLVDLLRDRVVGFVRAFADALGAGRGRSGGA